VFLIGPSIIMIRAGDLLLVVPPLYLRSQFWVLLDGVAKKVHNYKLN
jgi:hypothetical protein